jgi:hypothetical protein
VELAVAVTCVTGAPPANKAPAFERSGIRSRIGARTYEISAALGVAAADGAATICGTTLSVCTRVYVRGAICNGISRCTATAELVDEELDDDAVAGPAAGTASDRTIQNRLSTIGTCRISDEDEDDDEAVPDDVVWVELNVVQYPSADGNGQSSGVHVNVWLAGGTSACAAAAISAVAVVQPPSPGFPAGCASETASV